MSAKAFSRWQAAGTHLLICVGIAAVAITIMLGLWYPGPLFEAAGGSGLLYLLVGVDVVLGPLLTLIVFKSGKRGMKFDLTMIGTVQILALIYGMHIVFLARPAFIVFDRDRFELVTAVELDAADLARAKHAEFRSVGWGGPRFVAADLPTDPAERRALVDAALTGRDLKHMPRYFVPYAERTKEVLAGSVSTARLRATETTSGRAVDKYLASSGTRDDDVRAVMLRTRFAWLVVLVDPRTAQPVKMVLGEKIE
jgi:hypothetical protein